MIGCPTHSFTADDGYTLGSHVKTRLGSVCAFNRIPFLRVCLLECSVREVRLVVAAILEKTLESALHFGDPGLGGLTDTLLSLLDKDVPENVKNCAQYFSLFSNFAQRVIKSAFSILCHKLNSL